jgi:heterodisulfide reductase subunit A-like polyferredoxin
MTDSKKRGSVMVVGGGVAGMQAALDAAGAGFKVYLVETRSALGGQASALDKTFPTNDCAMCMLSPRLVEISNHPNIDILTLAEVKTLEGRAGDFRVTLRRRPRFVDVKKCTACGDCIDVCPVTIPDPFNLGLSDRKAIGRLYPQAVPSAFAIERTGPPPCRVTCPAGTNAQGYVALIAKGKIAEAYNLIRETNPFVSVCGRVCFHPCESNCTRKHIDSPVAVMALKRYIADKVKSEGLVDPAVLNIDEEKKRVNSARKVAVVGAGPAGLTCAYRLASEGYSVTLFEERAKCGGMMRYGIPDYRLPKDTLDWEIDNLLKAGIDLRAGWKLGRDGSIESLKSDGCEAVFIAIGAWQPVALGVENENAAGVYEGIRFLEAVASGSAPAIGKRVAVIGGGDAAMDAARTALRLGATDVHVLYRRTEAEMPASPQEREEAKAEGVKFEFLVAPTAFEVKGGKVAGVKCVRMRLGEPDASGRRRPVAIKGSDFIVRYDTVITSLSQKLVVQDLVRDTVAGPYTTPWDTVAIDPLTLSTPVPSVYAGGDAASGPATVIEAVAAGNRAARSIANQLAGRPLSEGQPPAEMPPLPPVSDETLEEAKLRMRSTCGRFAMPESAAAERVKDFREVALGYDDQTAVAEAARCLACGVCSDCGQCATVCKANAINYFERERDEEIEVGAVILAEGFAPFDAHRVGEYGYGRYPNVVTSLEFERLMSASGPTFGHVTRPSDRAAPKHIAFIQCVGSRGINESANPWCSGVCCMYATKEAIITKEHAPETDITIFYIDTRAHGKGYEKYRDSAEKRHGVRFVRSMPSMLRESKKTRNLMLRFQLDDGKFADAEFDMVVLSVGLEPAKSAREAAKALGIETDSHGFPKTSERSPVESTREGVFVAGAAAEPKDIPESVTTAAAAAAKVGEILAEARGTEIREEKFPEERPLDGEPKIGVFICHCGSNIAGVVDVEKMTEYVAGLPNVVHADHIMYTCSPDGLEKIRAAIREKGINRVVVSSCSPRTHEPIFRRAMREEGLNPYLFELANIRDQCAWVHQGEHEAATAKASDLARASVARAAHLEPLVETVVPVTQSALVIGGGAAGMTAALSIAGQGFKVTLVEKEKDLGGNLRQLRKSLGGIDFRAYLADLVSAVKSNERIEVLTESTLHSTGGYVGNFESVVRTPAGAKTVRHGVVIIATGASEYQPKEYAYGKDARVVTQREFEEKLAEGAFERGGAIVMIQCVGSRDDERPYCSRVCCTEAVKNALEAKRQSPETPVYVLMRDVRTYGFKEEAYRQAREAGVLFIRYDKDKKPVVEAGEALQVKVFDLDLNEEVTLPAGTVVLSAGIVARDDRQDVARVLKLPLTEDGFFLEAHMKLRPVDFATEGMYLAGLAHGPKLFDEAVAQALAAAGRAATVLSKAEARVGGAVAKVDEDLCAACLTCVRLCPYDVPVIREGAAYIEPAKCQGCGVCAGACPAKAIQVCHFTDEQVTAAAEALARGR